MTFTRPTANPFLANLRRAGQDQLARVFEANEALAQAPRIRCRRCRAIHCGRCFGRVFLPPARR